MNSVFHHMHKDTDMLSCDGEQGASVSVVGGSAEMAPRGSNTQGAVCYKCADSRHETTTLL